MNVRHLLKTLAMPLALLAIWGFFALRLDYDGLFGEGRLLFLSPRNLTNLAVEFSIIGTLALGMFLILLTGQIDLSVGSGVGLVGGIAAVLVSQQGWPAPAALLAGLAAALVLWALMGALIVKQRIPSFIITLGGLLVFKGVFWLVISNSTVSVKGVQENLYSRITTQYLSDNAGLVLVGLAAAAIAALQWRGRAARAAHGLPVASAGATLVRLAAVAGGLVLVAVVCNEFRGLPITLLILAAAALAAWFLTRHTPFGRYLYAIGGNEEAAVLSGINVDRVLIGAFVLMGAATAVTGFMQTAYQGSSSTTVGDLMELDAIAACVIGGTALKGGRGTVWGVLFGALIMTSLLNGMTLMAVSPELKFIARGSVLALAVWLDVRLGRA
jgi:D-xylose transport system permease protein